jgi:ferritin-like metal-binding protein YciE
MLKVLSPYYVFPDNCGHKIATSFANSSRDEPRNEIIILGGSKMAKTSTLEDLYVDELRDLYSAENQLVKALPKMAKAANSEDLKAGFEEHLKQTEGHVERLEKIFDGLDKSPKGKKCKAMEGLVEEGSEVIEEEMTPEVKDAALIAAGQRVEHYEMAGYGTVRTYAELLDYDDAAELLQATLDEEGDTNKKLMKLAKKLNTKAIKK